MIHQRYGSVTTGRSWRFIGRGLLLLVVCFFSPCCTPVWVPLGLGLLAGTPVALLLGHSLGLVYGALTAICVLGLVLTFYIFGKSLQVDPTRPPASETNSPQPLPFLPRSRATQEPLLRTNTLQTPDRPEPR